MTIDEPHEGTCFGFQDGRLNLRSIEDGKYGTELPERYAIQATDVIDAATRVLDLGQLRTKIAGTLPPDSSGRQPAAGGLTVRDMAMQLVKVPDQILFAPEAAS